MVKRYDVIKIERDLKKELERIKKELDAPSFSELVKLMYFSSNINKIKIEKKNKKRRKKRYIF